MKPYFELGGIAVYHGDGFDIIPGLGPIDVVLSDPPYSSGGLHIGSKHSAPTSKYITGPWVEGRELREFFGDSADQLSWMVGARAWLLASNLSARDGAHAYVFTDWRQLAATIISAQMAGWQYRGLVVWDKGNTARAPYPGLWRHGAEFLVWCSKGQPWTVTGGKFIEGVAPHHNVIPVPGVRDKQHITEKPVDFVTRVLKPAAPIGGLVVDPFMGSGTTLIAAQRLGLRAVGIDILEHNCEIAARRLEQAQGSLLPPAAEPSAAPARLFDDDAPAINVDGDA